MYILGIPLCVPRMSENFEFDDDKNRSNRIKHGITFGFARGIWLDRNMVVLQAKTEQEERIRIISARRARASERAQYEWQRVR